MAVAFDKFVKLLEESGLIPREDLAALLADIPAPRKADGEQLARELVKRKKLTAYQAQEVYAGRGKKLVLGNYVIQDKLGQGGMGMVLKAEHRRMERIVALKVMSKAAVESPEAVKRFHREVKAAAKLTHPNIVTAHDADEANGTHFLVMEFVEGTDLSQLVKKSGPLSVEKAVTCILQAARGLEFAHEHGIVHRDIKPANLLLDAKGHVKILDMGLARIESVGGDQAELTGTGQIMGTVDYMAPEQAMNTKKADHRADIYALGITLWYLLTGKAAYGGDTVMEKLMAHQSGPIPSFTELRQDVPPALEAVFRKMVAKTPGERYQSTSEVIAALERSRSGGGGDVSPTITLPSEDAKLSEFLKGMGGVQPSRSSVSPAVATAPSAPSNPAAPSTAAELEQTIVTSTPQTDTDPQTQTHLHASSLVPPPATPPAAPTPPPAAPRPAAPPLWWANPPILIGTGATAVVLLLLATWAIFFRGGNEVPPAKGPGGVPPDKVAKVPPPDFVPLFNRKDLTGWKPHPGYAGDWRVEKGVLLGSCSGRLFTYLFSERGDYGDFHLRAETRVASGTSAGITGRAPFPTPGPNVPRPVPGYLAKINADSAADPRKTGSLYFIDAADSYQKGNTVAASPIPADQWFRLEMIVQGKRVRILVNGQQTTDFEDTAGLFTSGHLALQVYQGQAPVEFRKLEIKELAKTGWHGWPVDAPKPAIAPFDAAQAKEHQSQWATYLNVPVEHENRLGMKFRLIPPGEFIMGGTAAEIEAALPDVGGEPTWQAYIKSMAPRHRVILTQPIYLSMNEVTQGQYEHVMGTNPSWFAKTGPGKAGVEKLANMDTTRFPVEHVSWNDAAEFCTKLSEQETLKPFYDRTEETVKLLAGTGYRLPSEAEWEMACRAGTTTKYWAGDQDQDLARVGWFVTNSGGRPHAVGELEPNPFGLYDMHGNLWEWVQDEWDATYYGQFSAKPAIDPGNPPVGSRRVQRGADFASNAVRCPSSYRVAVAPTFRGGTIGFRVALPVDAVKQALKKQASTGVGRPSKEPPAQQAAGARYALKFDGEKDLVDVADFKFDGQPPLTIEGWITPLRIDPDNFPVIDLGTGPHLGLKYKDNEWHAILSDGGSPSAYQIANAPGLRQANRRDHVAMTWNGTSIRCFVNGKGGASISLGSKLLPLRLKGALAIGFGNSQGLVSEARISKSLRYSQDFIPKERFESDDQTLALYHFDEGAGSVLRDDSGHHNHGVIAGAKWVLADGMPITTPPTPVAPPPAVAPFHAALARAHQDAWAKHLGVPREHTNDLGMKFVLIPPGEFLMGSPPEEIENALKAAQADWSVFVRGEGPRHKTILTQAVYFGVYEVTQAEYEKVMHTNPSKFAATGDGKESVAGRDTSNHPVEVVNWVMAEKYLEELSKTEKLAPLDAYRLPTEAQWEFACRAGTTTRYWFGDNTDDLPQAAWLITNSGGRTHAVGELRSNPFGLFDVHGNVWEWVRDQWAADYYSTFPNQPAVDPAGPPNVDSERILRGGSAAYSVVEARAAIRFNRPGGWKYGDYGFRATLPVSAVKAAIARKAASIAPQPSPTAHVDGVEFPLDGLRAVQGKFARDTGWNAASSRGPLLLQGSLGPVAFRKLRITPLDAPPAKP